MPRKLSEDRELVWWINHLYYGTDLSLAKIAKQVKHSEATVSKLIVSRVEYQLLEADQEAKLQAKLNAKAKK